MNTTNQFMAEYGLPVSPVVIPKVSVDGMNITIELEANQIKDLKIKSVKVQDADISIAVEGKIIVLTGLEDEILDNYKNYNFILKDKITGDIIGLLVETI